MTNNSPPYCNKTGENCATEMAVHPCCSESRTEDSSSCGRLGEEEGEDSADLQHKEDDYTSC